ncbi:hypothetical protein B0T20DRAFT_392461 [Sordaria brevicollis]|uniref:Uncharacterized protein n=1 Tax=Sordaria brevicollis TaxID=83679 RepID=A0AAE0UDH6_SORBR|nr:hypothetical protein B0T20DRAFT_392461 [Sordaria brevicollis]
MCIVWWSSGCPHCRHLCLAPVPVGPPDRQKQQHNNNNRHNSQQVNPPHRPGGLGPSRPQAPVGNINAIPHPATRTRLSWVKNPFAPETPCLEVERIWRCYEVDTRLSISESLRPGKANEIAWGKGGGDGGSCGAGLDPASVQERMYGATCRPDGTRIGSEAGFGAGFGAGSGAELGGRPISGMEKDSRVESGSTGVNHPGPPAPDINMKHMGTSIVNPYLALNLPPHTASHRRGSRLEPPNPAAASTPMTNSPERNYFQDNANVFNPYPEVKDSELAAFCTLFDSESESDSDDSESPSPPPTPSPEPDILPYAFPYTHVGAKPFLGDQQTFLDHSQAFRPHYISSKRSPGSKTSSSHPLSTSYVIPGRNHENQAPNVPNRPGSRKGAGGLESFRLCPLLQHLDASNPEEKHPREECWLTRWRWGKVMGVGGYKHTNGRFGNRQQQYGQNMERQWWRLLGRYLPVGGRGAGIGVAVRMGDICPYQ